MNSAAHTTNTDVTCGDISETSDLVWQLLCKVEDQEIDEPAAWAMLTSAVDRKVFAECMSEMRQKWIAEETATPRQRIYFETVSSYETAILKSQENYLEY
tara:strand:- start:327 stop:626 length:300 start_codon:yes stop_codon:yes gene_type:complete